jgi:Bardet-Biedl syndrome 1 protein
MIHISIHTHLHTYFYTQKDLCKLRLRTARTYLDTLSTRSTAASDSSSGTGPGTSTSSSSTSSSSSSVTLNVQVQGLGPYFKLKLDVLNNGSSPLYHLPLVVTFSHELYRANQSRITCPVLLPSVMLSYSIEIECLDENSQAGVVRVLVLNPNSNVPFASTIVKMPQSDMLE